MGGGPTCCSEALRRWNQCSVLRYHPFPQCILSTWNWRTHPLAVLNRNQSMHNHNTHWDRRKTKQEKIMLLCSFSNLTHRNPFSQARRYFMYEFYWLFSDYSQSDSIRYLAVNHNYIEMKCIRRSWDWEGASRSGMHGIRVAGSHKQLVIWKLPPSPDRRFCSLITRWIQYPKCSGWASRYIL